MALPPFVPIAQKAFRQLEKGGDVLWNEPRVFSRWEAWVDLIVNARGPRKRAIPRRGAPPLVLDLEPGEAFGSLTWFAQRWTWSAKRVRTFLLQLEHEMDRIRAVRETQVGTVYLLVNYESYNVVGTAEGTAEGTPREQHGHSTGTNNKEYKEEYKGESVKESFEVDVDEEAQGANEEPNELPPQPTSDDDDEWVSYAIRCANKGMIDTGLLYLQPILMGHASRQNVHDWLEAGTPRELIASTVYAVAKQAKKQISSMGYFNKPVAEALEKVQSGNIATPKDPYAGTEAGEARAKEPKGPDGTGANAYQEQRAKNAKRASSGTSTIGGAKLQTQEEIDQQRVDAWRADNVPLAAAIWQECVNEVRDMPGSQLFGQRTAETMVRARFRQRVIAEYLTPKLAQAS